MKTRDELKEMLINNAASWGDKEGDEMAEIYVNDFLDELLGKFKLLPIQNVSQRSELACDLLRKISEENMCSVVADEWIHEFFKSQTCG